MGRTDRPGVGRTALSRRPARLLLLLIAAAAAGFGAVGATAKVPAPPRAASAVFDVRAYGAVGDGRRNDAPAINRAIAAANRAGGGVVLVPAGTYLAAGSIHMLSHVTLDLAARATLLGARSGYDDPEPNRYEAYSDPGHAHFHDALIWGENLHDIAFVGRGTIDGGKDNLVTAQPIPGRADKLISLVRCTDLTISGITLRRGGHFALLTNDCDHITSADLTIDSAEASDGRDGWDVINARDVAIKNITIHSWDDALAFKSDWALGETLPNGNVTVAGARLSSVCCNALMFGSETCGNFSGYRFSHITITGAGKSGLGMVSMDGAQISDVSYSDVAMSDVAGAIMEKIGTRRRCGGHPGIGDISGVRYSNVTAVSPDTYTATLWGLPGHWISDVSFTNVHLFLAGGHGPVPWGLPSQESEVFDPESIGIRPSYGLYMHDVSDITIADSSLTLAAPDARPPLMVAEGAGVTLEGVLAQAGTATLYEAVMQGVSGVRLGASRAADGGPFRLLRLGLPPCLWCTLQGPSKCSPTRSSRPRLRPSCRGRPEPGRTFPSGSARVRRARPARVRPGPRLGNHHDHGRPAPADQPPAQRAGEQVAGLHRASDHDQVRRELLGDPQKLFGGVPAGVDEGQLEAELGCAQLCLRAQVRGPLPGDLVEGRVVADDRAADRRGDRHPGFGDRADERRHGLPAEASSLAATPPEGIPRAL